MSINNEYKKEYEIQFKKALNECDENFYDDVALPSYIHKNKLMSWLFWNRIKIALKYTNNLKGAKILDFGCGGGVLFKYLHQQGALIYGCDIKSYELAKIISSNFNIQSNIFKNLDDINEEKFDYIFALDVLEHLENLDKYIDKFKKLSHKNTKLIISLPTENFIYKIGRFLAGFSGHYHYTNAYKVENFLNQKGLKLLKVKNLYNFIPLFRISLWEF